MLAFVDELIAFLNSLPTNDPIYFMLKGTLYAIVDIRLIKKDVMVIVEKEEKTTGSFSKADIIQVINPLYNNGSRFQVFADRKTYCVIPSFIRDSLNKYIIEIA